jgi:hypothetical protein
MAGAHRNMMLIKDLSDVVRVHTLQVEGKNTEPPLAGIEQSETRNARQPVDPVTGQRLLMLENVVASEFLDEVDRRTEANRPGYVGRTGFVPVPVPVPGFVEVALRSSRRRPATAAPQTASPGSRSAPIPVGP